MQMSKAHLDELVAKASGNEKTGVYEKVEIESEFPGGAKAWAVFLNTHLRYPSKAVGKRIEGRVILQFIVEKDGSISDLSALSGDPLLAEAPIKALQQSPHWTPAMQNGNPGFSVSRKI